MTAKRFPLLFDKILFNKVVFPAPRNPESTDTGILFSMVFHLIFTFKEKPYNLVIWKITILLEIEEK
jgi:hypothetical protein